MKKEGPVLRIVASCHQCVHLKVTPFSVNGKSSRDCECTHVDGRNGPFGAIGYISERQFDSTPQWCPLLKQALHAFTAGNPQHKVNQ